MISKTVTRAALSEHLQPLEEALLVYQGQTYPVRKTAAGHVVTDLPTTVAQDPIVLIQQSLAVLDALAQQRQDRKNKLLAAYRELNTATRNYHGHLGSVQWAAERLGHNLDLDEHV